MSAQHTPGPWVLNSGVSSNVVLIDSNATNGAVGEIVDCRNRADALLIAAAPDLLEALKYCRQKIAYMQAHGEWCWPEGAIENADAAIAKATGVQA
jgi:hypothetical protein